MGGGEGALEREEGKRRRELTGFVSFSLSFSRWCCQTSRPGSTSPTTASTIPIRTVRLFFPSPPSPFLRFLFLRSLPSSRAHRLFFPFRFQKKKQTTEDSNSSNLRITGLPSLELSFLSLSLFRSLLASLTGGCRYI